MVPAQNTSAILAYENGSEPRTRKNQKDALVVYKNGRLRCLNLKVYYNFIKSNLSAPIQITAVIKPYLSIKTC